MPADHAARDSSRTRRFCGELPGVRRAVDDAAARCAIRMPSDIGLHLDLTEPRRTPLSPALGSLLVDALLHRLDRRDCATRSAQLDPFERPSGTRRIVDGHRHVHQLPGVRDQLVRELMHRYPLRCPWLRRTVPRQKLRGGAKPLVVAALGSRGFDALTRRQGLQHNRCMLGVYEFGDDEDAYLQRLTRWLRRLKTAICWSAIRRPPASLTVRLPVPAWSSIAC